MSTLKEFRDFAMKGNVLDLAIGVIIGAAFGKIVSSLVGDVLMPLVGILLGKLDFSTLALHVGEATIRYGLFIQSIIDFVIVASCVFLIVKQVTRMQKPQKPGSVEAPAPSPEVRLLTEIRDLLSK